MTSVQSAGAVARAHAGSYAPAGRAPLALPVVESSVAANAWDVNAPRRITEEDVRREAERLRR